MEPAFNEEELKEIARQLSCPEGDNGIKTGERMQDSNAYMIRSAMEALAVKPGEKILEIGHGNGAHIAWLMEQAPALHYEGLDISATMYEEARKINQELVASGKVSFALSDGKNIGYETGYFDKIFTVNTLYFWENPVEYAKEIYRVLKPGGSFCLCFAQKDFMQAMPFTRFGFQLYDLAEAEQVLKNGGFKILEILEKTEEITASLGVLAKRDFIVITAIKP